MNRVGQICLATVHQRQLLTNVCSLAEAANDLSRVMHMQFVIHEALIYVPSYRRVVCLIRPTQRSTDVSFEGVIQLGGEHMTPCLYSGVKSHIKQAVRIIIRNCVNLIYCKVVVEGNSLKKRQE